MLLTKGESDTFTSAAEKGTLYQLNAITAKMEFMSSTSNKSLKTV